MRKLQAEIQSDESNIVKLKENEKRELDVCAYMPFAKTLLLIVIIE